MSPECPLPECSRKTPEEQQKCWDWGGSRNPNCPARNKNGPSYGKLFGSASGGREKPTTPVLVTQEEGRQRHAGRRHPHL